ncbi:hypothetical protein BAE44_0023466 [Dichanthelium oligosanthes]|uniref:Uncharacterized protein n=1 Tax=Dichanthelium oligosanthes TaxID=888268 RepID=A0A1E5URR5_9POAL|nr:hypothetical protein BAE44_0023466 [Dichanthelium oligosanthes]
MASMMMGGDFVEAYVLKNAYKEKLRRMEAAEEIKKSKRGSGSGSGSCSGEKKASSGGSKGGGLFGLMKKKVHPKAAAPSEARGASS